MGSTTLEQLYNTVRMRINRFTSYERQRKLASSDIIPYVSYVHSQEVQVKKLTMRNVLLKTRVLEIRPNSTKASARGGLAPTGRMNASKRGIFFDLLVSTGRHVHQVQQSQQLRFAMVQ